MLQVFLDQRRPGTSRFVTQRKEPDQVKILSGVFEDDRTDGPVTTGTPISLLIENVDQRSKDYSEIQIILMMLNMACAIIAVAGAPRRAKQLCAWQQAA
jgi:chorismate synthase